jgi:hypothetical protein
MGFSQKIKAGGPLPHEDVIARITAIGESRR